MLNNKRIVGRSCGDCTVCCTVMAVRELGKPLRSRCEHLCGKGCGIYDSRPKSCREFECVWLQGHIGNEEQRPDKLGIMFTMTKNQEQYVLHAWEVWEEARKQEKVRYLFGKIAEKIVFMIRLFGGGTELMGRKLSIEKFMKVHGLG
jgi:Fe-S-cluster containining protein